MFLFCFIHLVGYPSTSNAENNVHSVKGKIIHMHFHTHVHLQVHRTTCKTLFVHWTEVLLPDNCIYTELVTNRYGNKYMYGTSD